MISATKFIDLSAFNDPILAVNNSRTNIKDVIKYKGLPNYSMWYTSYYPKILKYKGKKAQVLEISVAKESTSRKVTSQDQPYQELNHI